MAPPPPLAYWIKVPFAGHARGHGSPATPTTSRMGPTSNIATAGQVAMISSSHFSGLDRMTSAARHDALRFDRTVSVACRVAGCVAVIAAVPARADDELQKKLANPAADLITLPVQLTTTFDSGPLGKPQHTLNVQPVYPVRLGGEWRLINRLIVPLQSNPAGSAGQERENGLGDILYEGFFSPAKDGDFTWAIGPVFQFDSATDERLGSGKWAAGPAAVILAQPGRWSVGAIVTQRWSFAGDEARARVDQMQIQPILSYRVNALHSIAYAGSIVANWAEDRSGQRWTVPLGVTWSTLTKSAGGLPVNIVFGGGYNVVRPDFVGAWYLRLQVSVVFAR